MCINIYDYMIAKSGELKMNALSLLVETVSIYLIYGLFHICYGLTEKKDKNKLKRDSQ